MALELTQLLTEMSTGNISRVEGGGGLKAPGAQGCHPSHLFLPIVLKFGTLKIPGPLRACPGL